MPTSKQTGIVNILLVLVVFLMIATLSLGGLSIYYIVAAGRAQTTADQQAMIAAEAARQEQKLVDEAEFKERQKNPYRTYSAPQVLAALSVSFPKTWSLYVDENQASKTQLELYFNPDYIVAPNNYEGAYVLRLKLERNLYSEVVKTRLRAIEKGELAASPISIKGIAGTKYVGLVEGSHLGVLVILPLRDKTLSIWTEARDYEREFTSILEQIQVSP